MNKEELREELQNYSKSKLVEMCIKLLEEKELSQNAATYDELLLFLLFVPYMLADYIKPLQKFFCKIGWHCHQKDYITESFDGASMHCKCKWCGYKGMVDSQGNLF